jgi:precorrin-2/cobalt-factor-2 C20-methyltransferase
LKGTLYGVGVGPGDKKLLTLLAVETLHKADIIAVPDTGGEKTALNIVGEYISGKKIMYCSMPMTRDTAILRESHKACVELICAELEKGLNLAFITLGDPTIYSTYMYVHRLVVEKGYSAEIVNGIPSFCAAAAKLGISLCNGKEALHIVPASYEGADELLRLNGSKVLMKSGKGILNIKQKLEKHNLLDNSKMVECCFMENEKIYNSLRDLNEDSSYFSIIIVKGE